MQFFSTLLSLQRQQTDIPELENEDRDSGQESLIDLSNLIIPFCPLLLSLDYLAPFVLPLSVGVFNI